MFSPFPLFVGLRHFTSGSTNRLVSFISFLAILGLVLGVALLVVVMSIMNGFDHEMETRILGSVPHIRLFKEQGVGDVVALQQELESIENVHAAMPFAQIEGLLAKQSNTHPVEILGLSEDLSQPFIGGFVSPKLLSSLNGEGKRLLLAKGVASRLSAEVGDRVSLLVPQTGKHNNRSVAPKLRVFKIAGIFETHTALDQRLAIARLDVVGALASTNGLPQGMQVKLDDVFQARQTGFKILRSLPQGYRFSDWIQTHGNLYQAIKMSRNMVSLLVLLIIGIAVFNVISMLMMTVIDKRPAIAILKTQGATNGEIVATFLTQGFFIGAAGSLLGALIGVACAWKASAIVGGIEKLLGLRFLNSEVYPIDYLPSELVWGDVLLVVIVALGLNFIATLYPAIRAARTRPAEVLRYE